MPRKPHPDRPFEAAFRDLLRVGTDAGLPSADWPTLIRIALGTVAWSKGDDLENAARVELLRRIREGGWSPLDGHRDEPLFVVLWTPLVSKAVDGPERHKARRIRAFYDALTSEGRTLVADLLTEGEAVLSGLDEAASEWNESVRTEL